MWRGGLLSTVDMIRGGGLSIPCQGFTGAGYVNAARPSCNSRFCVTDRHRNDHKAGWVGYVTLALSGAGWRFV